MGIILLLFFAFVAVPPIHAYLDPGSGSYVIQVLIGAVIGGGYLVKSFWKNIVAFIKKIFKK